MVMEIATKVVVGIILLAMGNSFSAFILIQLGRHQLDKIDKLKVRRDDAILTDIIKLKDETVCVYEANDKSLEDIGYLVSIEKTVNNLKVWVNINALLFLSALLVYGYSYLTENNEIEVASTFLFVLGLVMQAAYYSKKHKSQIVDLLITTGLEDKTQSYIRQLSK